MSRDGYICKSGERTRSTTGRSSGRTTSANCLDLLGFATNLLDAHQTHEVTSIALRFLARVAPRTNWAILRRVEGRKYEVSGRGALRHVDLRILAEKACGPETWLSVLRAGSDPRSAGDPIWCAMPTCHGGRNQPPELVVGFWKTPGRRAPLTQAELEAVSLLMFTASSSARLFESLQEQSSRDPLTDLLNRRGTWEVLDRELARAHRKSSTLSLLYIDLDLFKRVNDLYGHSVGDEVLRSVASTLRSTLRSSDALGRVGGDEFVAVLSDTDLATASIIGRRLEQRLKSLSIATSAGRFSVGLTFGVASTEQELTRAGVVELADSDMLDRKKKRRRGHSERVLVKTPV